MRHSLFLLTNLLCVIVSISCISQAQVANIEGIDAKKMQEDVGRVTHGELGLRELQKNIVVYRTIHDGRYPESTADLLNDMADNYASYGFGNWKSAFESLRNADAAYSTSFASSKPEEVTPYLIWKERRNGLPLGAPSRPSERDVIATCDIYYFKRNIVDKEGDENSIYYGYWLVLWSDGKVEKLPFDSAILLPKEKGFIYCFEGQAGIPYSAISFSEFHSTYLGGFPLTKPLVSGFSNEDNGALESLISYSRRISYPLRFGIERENLWRVFNPSQSEFTLAEVQVGALQLGLNTQAKKQTIAQLQKSGTPALLFLQDDGRIVTLTALDDDRAVVIDRGVTQNVERSVLEKRYSGEALVPTKALTQNAAIVADDAVREAKLPSLDAEVPQQFVLRNTGATPITLQLEYPLLGVTESKLSQDVIAPGETATLDLKVKWRSILKAPYQNVLVSIQTNDPIVPRLQLAILLTPPGQTGN